MKSLLKSILPLTLFCLISSSTFAARPVRINIGTLAPRGSAVYKSLKSMADEWKKISGGKVKLVIYPDGTQGGEADMVRLMKLGSLQGGGLTSVGLGEIVPEIKGMQGLPLLIRSYEELDHLTTKLGPTFEPLFEKKGFVFLFWADAGWIHFFSKEKMTTPDDLKKMKFFVWAGDSEHAEMVKKAGYRGIPLETADIQTGLQTGLIDVADMPPMFALAGQIDRRAPHMLDLKWAPLIGGMVIKKDAWEKIPKEIRPQLLASAQKAGAAMRASNRKESTQAIEAMKKRGLNVHNTSEELTAVWRKEAEDKVYPLMIGHSVPTPIYKQVTELLEAFRASQPK